MSSSIDLELEGRTVMIATPISTNVGASDLYFDATLDAMTAAGYTFLRL